ncbi:MAG: hypothetical protein ABIK32_01430 [Chloroflexota bacterium]|nr:hypothetical protein [Chloroflexota bacterium]
MKRVLKKLIRPKFIILVTTTIIAIFLAYVPSAQAWVSSNMTIVENWEKETNMPSSILILFGVLIIGSFVYLIYDALKESDTERIEKMLGESGEKLDKIIKILEKGAKDD